MEKSDLKDGMIVEYKDGKFGLKLGARIISQNEHLELEDLEENLTTTNELDVIVRVYESVNVHFFSEINDKSKLKLIWERPIEIDWAKVPRWIKVQVKDYPEEPWYNAYFIGLDDSNEDYPYKATFCDAFTLIENSICGYIQCRIHPEQEIKEEWYK
ncbi:hypothetical protein ACSW8L_16710 (plasmid) [Clostridium perfringens]